MNINIKIIYTIIIYKKKFFFINIYRYCNLVNGIKDEKSPPYPLLLKFLYYIL